MAFLEVVVAERSTRESRIMIIKVGRLYSKYLCAVIYYFGSGF